MQNIILKNQSSQYLNIEAIQDNKKNMKISHKFITLSFFSLSL